MTVKELAKHTGLTVLNGADSLNNEIVHIYTCDLLSLVMGRAQPKDAWITVMGNVNSVAVASLADVACIVLAEGIGLDHDAREKAAQQDIAVLASDAPVYETACLVQRVLDR